MNFSGRKEYPTLIQLLVHRLSFYRIFQDLFNSKLYLKFNSVPLHSNTIPPQLLFLLVSRIDIMRAILFNVIQTVILCIRVFYPEIQKMCTAPFLIAFN